MRNDRARMKDAFERLYARYPRLKEKRRLAAGVLSGREQRMLEIARLTMTGPKTLLLDEPSVGLMPKLVDEVYAEIARLKEERYTILIVDTTATKAIGITDSVYAPAPDENRYQGPRAGCPAASSACWRLPG